MRTVAFKGSDYLKTQKHIVVYLNAALGDGEPAVLLEALRNVAIAKGGMVLSARPPEWAAKVSTARCRAKEPQDRDRDGIAPSAGATSIVPGR